MYQESLLIDRDVTIVADTDDGEVRIVAAFGPAVQSTALQASIKGVSVCGSDRNAPAVVVSAGSLTLEDCDVSVGRIDEPVAPPVGT